MFETTLKEGEKPLETTNKNSTVEFSFSMGNITGELAYQNPKILLVDDEETHWELTKEANDKIKRGLKNIKEGRVTSLEDIKKEFED